MRRYLLSILLAVFAFGGIGSYYIYGAVNRAPDYRLVATDGDGSRLNGLTLSGNVSNMWGSHYVNISEKGTVYDEYRSVLGHREIHPLASDLDPEHHSFLRGKSQSNVNYYVSDQVVIYAELGRKIGDDKWEMTAGVEMLDLQNGKRTRFQQTLDSFTYKDWPYLADVQLVNGELHLFAEVMNSYRDYVLSTDGELLRAVRVKDWSAIDREAGEDSETENVYSLVSNHRPQDPKEVVGIITLTHRAGQGGLMDLLGVELDLYHYGSEELRPLGKIRPDEWEAAHPHFSDLMTNEVLYLAWSDEKKLRIDAIPLPNPASPIEYEYTADELGGDQIVHFLLKDDQMYVLVRSNGSEANHGIAVIRLDTGEIAAKGRIVPPEQGPEGLTAEQMSANLWVHAILSP